MAARSSTAKTLMTDSLREIFDFLKAAKLDAEWDGLLYDKQMFEQIEDILLEMGNREAEYVARVEHLLKTWDLYDSDGTYTFPDGETWQRSQV